MPIAEYMQKLSGLALMNDFFIILPIDLFYLILDETSLSTSHVVKQKLLRSVQICA